MYCNYCGKVIQEDANFCGYCSTRVAGVACRRRLMRSRTNRKIAGVCAGVAEYFDFDVTLVRVVWLLVTLLGFPFGLVAYIVCWIVMPEEPYIAYAPAPAHAVQQTQTPQ